MLSPPLAVVQQNPTSIQRWLQLAALNKFNLEHIVQCHFMIALGISIANYCQEKQVDLHTFHLCATTNKLLLIRHKI